jgi:hypothetical protein
MPHRPHLDNPLKETRRFAFAIKDPRSLTRDFGSAACEMARGWVTDKVLRTQVSNRSRWMAVRALGSIGDKTVVPDLTHLLYRDNTFIRGWAQIALVQLTGQNFGPDWKAWGNWWNAQGGQPTFRSEMIRWSPRQPEPDKLAETFGELDRKFVAGLKARSPGSLLPTEAEESADKMREPQQ